MDVHRAGVDLVDREQVADDREQALAGAVGD
jgi:hypothetical protein